MSISAAVIISSIVHKKLLFAVTPIQVMPLVNQPAVKSGITGVEYHRFHRLRMHLDSLAKSKEGRLRLDSLLTLYPNLPETLLRLEAIYQQQPKN